MTLKIQPTFAVAWTAKHHNQTARPMKMNYLTRRLALALFAGATTILFTSCASDGHDHQHGAAAKAYPLDKCIVTDEAFEHGKPYVFVHDGQEIKLCCKDCLGDFKKDPAKYLARLNAAK